MACFHHLFGKKLSRRWREICRARPNPVKDPQRWRPKHNFFRKRVIIGEYPGGSVANRCSILTLFALCCFPHPSMGGLKHSQGTAACEFRNNQDAVHCSCAAVSHVFAAGPCGARYPRTQSLIRQASTRDLQSTMCDLYPNLSCVVLLELLFDICCQLQKLLGDPNWIYRQRVPRRTPGPPRRCLGSQAAGPP